MPRKQPSVPLRVPIDAARVRAAMRFADLSSRGLATRLRERGALPKPLAAGLTRPSASAIDWIRNGTTKTVRRELREAIAHVCGEPITSEFLGGEAPLDVPPLKWPPSAQLDLSMPYEMYGDRQTWADGVPPSYELVARILGAELSGALNRDNPMQRQPWPDLRNATRWLLSIAFWREFLFEGQRHGQSVPDMQADAELFATHMAEAMRALLRPWLNGKVTTRQHLIRKAVFELDRLAMVNEDIATERHTGRFADSAIRDQVNGYVGSEDARELRALLESARDKLRAEGVDERQIARMIRAGSRHPDGEKSEEESEEESDD
jgi:hypothetical protein